MKVHVLVDNTDGERLKGEWGLSFYIEYKGRIVLLDAGLSPLFADIRAFAHRLEQTGAETFYTGHCTGKKAMDILCEELGSKVHALKTDMIFEVG